MAIKLGSNPKQFTKAVEIVLLDDTTDVINVNYKYRNREEFAQLLDERRADDKMERANLAAAEKDLSEEKKDAAFSVKKLFVDSTKKSAERVLQIANGWDMAEPFDVEHLMWVENEFPGALQSIEAKYQKSVAEVRVKN